MQHFVKRRLMTWLMRRVHTMHHEKGANLYESGCFGYGRKAWEDVVRSHRVASRDGSFGQKNDSQKVFVVQCAVLQAKSIAFWWQILGSYQETESQG